MKLQLLLTGSELMAGHTVDSNSAMIAEQLATIGFSIDRKVTLGDDFEALVAEMDKQSQDSDVLIVNGGLGPTIDDLTAAALAQLTGVALEEHPQALAHLEAWCERRKVTLNEANRKQAILPAGSQIIPNPSGSAVGFCMEYQQCLLICTPGVPSELRLMMEQTILALLTKRFPNQRAKQTLRFQTFGLGESSLQQYLSKEYPDWPAEIELGFRAGLPQLEVKLTLSDPDHQPTLAQCQQKLESLIGDYIIGADNTTLASAVIALLKSKGKKLTSAESCTGGLIAAKITEIAGASAVFEAGFVTYSNTMKARLLGVDEQLLIEYGAVSEQVVLAMAKGALLSSEADYAVAVSGVAGPDGGTEEKPVGTVWIAWGTSTDMQAHCFQFNAPRNWFQTMVAATALDLIRRQLLNLTEEPLYLRRWSKR